MDKELKILVEKYCMGRNPESNQMDQILDLANQTGADPAELFEYINKVKSGPTWEQHQAQLKKETEEKARLEIEKKKKEELEAKEKARQEAQRRAKEAAEAEERAKAKAEAEAKAKEMARKKAAAERERKEEAARLAAKAEAERKLQEENIRAQKREAERKRKQKILAITIPFGLLLLTGLIWLAVQYPWKTLAIVTILVGIYLLRVSWKFIVNEYSGFEKWLFLITSCILGIPICVLCGFAYFWTM